MPPAGMGMDGRRSPVPLTSRGDRSMTTHTLLENSGYAFCPTYHFEDAECLCDRPTPGS